MIAPRLVITASRDAYPFASLRANIAALGACISTAFSLCVPLTRHATLGSLRILM